MWESRFSFTLSPKRINANSKERIRENITISCFIFRRQKPTTTITMPVFALSMAEYSLSKTNIRKGSQILIQRVLCPSDEQKTIVGTVESVTLYSKLQFKIVTWIYESTPEITRFTDYCLMSFSVALSNCFLMVRTNKTNIIAIKSVKNISIDPDIFAYSFYVGSPAFRM